MTRTGEGPRPLAEHAAPNTDRLNCITVVPFCKLPVSILHRSDLSAMAKVVFSYLLDRQGRKSVSWPSLERIATDCGTTKPAAIRAIAELKMAKLLRVRRPRGDERGRSNRYEIFTDGKLTGVSGHCADRLRIVTPDGNESLPDSESTNQHPKPDLVGRPITTELRPIVTDSSRKVKTS